MSPFGSQDVRAAVLRVAARKLTAQQQEAVRQYMHPHVFLPQDVVEAATLLESLARCVCSSKVKIK